MPKESPNIWVLFYFALMTVEASVPPVSSQQERTFISAQLNVYLPCTRMCILPLNLKLPWHVVIISHGCGKFIGTFCETWEKRCDLSAPWCVLTWTGQISLPCLSTIPKALINCFSFYYIFISCWILLPLLYRNSWAREPFCLQFLLYNWILCWKYHGRVAKHLIWQEKKKSAETF